MVKKSKNSDGDDEGPWLWQAVTKTVKPYQKKATSTSVKLLSQVKKTPKSTAKPALTLSRSATPVIEAKLDLHGMTQDKAFKSLHRFIEKAIAHGYKRIIVITGKGASKTAAGEQGVLQRMVPLWLETGVLAPYVRRISQAAKEHGGTGALYIDLRPAK